MDNTGEKLSLKEKIGYGLGDTASNLYFQMFVNFLLFFYTDIFGIPAAAAGTMLMVSRFWDAANDPIMGIIADRTNTKWGKFRPYLIWMSGPLAIFGVLAFTTPPFDVTGKIIYAYITFTLVMMAYTAVNIPYSALMGVISPNSQERTSVSTFRFVLAFVGAFIVQGLTLPLVDFFGGGDQALGFPFTMGVYGILACILFYITFKTTRERVVVSSDQKTALKDDLRDLIRNRPWMYLLVMGIFTLGYIIIRSGTILYYFKYYIGSEALASLFMVLGTIGVIAGVASTQFFAKKFGKKRFYIFVMSLTTILTMIFYFLPSDQIFLIFALHILISFIMAPQAPLLWAMYADTADYSEWKNERRATGLVFSAATFAQKFGIAVGGGMAGWMLALFGFVPNTAQAPETLDGIKMMMSFIPAAGTLIATIAAFFYELDDNTMKKIENDLKLRKANGQQEGIK
ncbi:putative cation symporter [Melioribacter roseus P3M-2]|uniref:Putative cation symporter n=1 Tax=Melioribacter roseus (strain DSM 23840 / JCM 17771 / VKM B-2668 / P3M-2) TaxID=1191523 RepID=I6ZMW0_MELRP|nr:MFS transporter [Melioribacter roseus]AFN73359.1 putative cation symporter [Melioribacter roseus P3M-2]